MSFIIFTLDAWPWYSIKKVWIGITWHAQEKWKSYQLHLTSKVNTQLSFYDSSLHKFYVMFWVCLLSVLYEVQLNLFSRVSLGLMRAAIQKILKFSNWRYDRTKTIAISIKLFYLSILPVSSKNKFELIPML